MRKEKESILFCQYGHQKMTLEHWRKEEKQQPEVLTGSCCSQTKSSCKGHQFGSFLVLSACSKG